MPEPRQKQEIEDLYRKKLQARFKKSDESPTLKFLNTNFGLFLLSSVFISLFSWAYHGWTTYQTRLHEDRKTYQKISLELMNRLRYLEKLKAAFEFDDRKVIQQALAGFDASANVNPSWVRHYGAMFPEYQRRSMSSLVWELERLSKSDKRPKLQAARKKVDLVESYLGRLRYYEVDGSNKGPDKKIGMYTLSPEDQSKFKAEVLDPLRFLGEPEDFYID